MTAVFERPLRARHNCRHYSYEPGLQGGPRCAAGVDMSGPGASGPCLLPEHQRGTCEKREEYTDAEREAWSTFRDQAMERLGRSVQALPAPIPLNTSGKIACPNCDGGELRYARWHRGAEIQCTTPNCCGPVHFSIAAGADWPSPKEST
jgi:hypothetical protein